MKVLLIGIATQDGTFTVSREYKVPNTRGTDRDRVLKQAKFIYQFINAEMSAPGSTGSQEIDEILVVYHDNVVCSLRNKHWGDESVDPEDRNDG